MAGDTTLKGYRKYLVKKLLWYLLTFVIAIIVNFLLPRLVPGNPIATITSKLTAGMNDANLIKAVYEQDS